MPLTLVKLSQMAADLPEIHELDINPLLADENGVLALDARVGIRVPARLFAGQTRFAVRPYPTEWERQLQLKGRLEGLRASDAAGRRAGDRQAPAKRVA